MKELEEVGNSTTCPHIIFVRDGRLLLGYRHYKKEGQPTLSVWTMPGGRCDEGETVEQTLRREAIEEVGIKDFEITDFLGTVPGAKAGDVSYVFAGKTAEEPKLMEPEKTSEWRWVAPEEFPANFINKNSAELIKNFVRKNR